MNWSSIVLCLNFGMSSLPIFPFRNIDILLRSGALASRGGLNTFNCSMYKVGMLTLGLLLNDVNVVRSTEQDCFITLPLVPLSPLENITTTATEVAAPCLSFR